MARRVTKNSGMVLTCADTAGMVRTMVKVLGYDPDSLSLMEEDTRDEIRRRVEMGIRYGRHSVAPYRVALEKVFSA